MKSEPQNSRYTVGSSSINLEDKIVSLFEPDTLLSAQYWESVRRRTFMEPEKVLMLAVLRDAINCFHVNVVAHSGKRKKLFDEAEGWILEKDNDWIFSFASVCETLRVNPEYVRGGLQRWKEKQLAHLIAHSRENKIMAGYSLAANDHS